MKTTICPECLGVFTKTHNRQTSCGRLCATERKVRRRRASRRKTSTKNAGLKVPRVREDDVIYGDRPAKERPLFVSFGGGVNSTALIVELVRRRIYIDGIFFADTGGERPETYRTVDAVSDWLQKQGRPMIHSVSHGESLEASCLRSNSLPSAAYGFSGCAVKWKRQPILKALKARLADKEPWVMAIGIDAGEERRVRISTEQRELAWYPLVQWSLDRARCAEIAKSIGIEVGKSACFFCPHTRKTEILDLQKNHPKLLQRALKLEANADLNSLAGLGRRFSWRDVVNTRIGPHGTKEPFAFDVFPCGCSDGE